jgi:hypothetical protein
MKKVSIEYTPLPEHMTMKSDARQAYIRREVRALEDKFRQEREARGKKVMGHSALIRISHRARPENPSVQTKKPLCHASSKEAAQQYKEEFNVYLNAYRVASDAYRSGAYDTVFPNGAIRPPLITVCRTG